MRTWILYASLATLLALAGPGTHASAESPAAKADIEAIEQSLASHGEANILVLLADTRARDGDRQAIAAEVDALLAEVPPAHVQVHRRFMTVPALSLRIDATGLEALRSSARVAEIGLDVGGQGGLVQSLPLAQVDAVRILGYTGSGTRIAIIDSGLRLDHQSFAGRIVDQACFCTNCCPNGGNTQLGPGSGANSHPHGTNVAGIAAGATGVPGVPAGAAPQADLISIRVLDANNSFSTSADIIAALDWLRVQHPGTTVINLSLGTSVRFPGHCDAAAPFTKAYAAVINGLVAQGSAVTVSSGNNGSSVDMQVPACIQNAISVAAVWDANVGTPTVLGCTEAMTAPDQVTCFSNLSTTTDLLAPGAPVTAAGTGSSTGTSTFSGTSMAAPLTAGCIALLRQAFPNLGPAAVESALKASPVRRTRPPMVQDYPRVDCLDAFVRLDRLFDNGFQ